MINVVQILLGECPPFIDECMQSVKSFAERNAYTYTVIREANDYNCGDLRHLSEQIRLDILAECKYTLYVDWDIELFDNFCVPDCLTVDPQTPDCLVYNNEDTEFFKQGRGTISEDLSLIAFKAIINMSRKGYTYSTFNRDTYKHYEYSCNREFYETN